MCPNEIASFARFASFLLGESISLFPPSTSNNNSNFYAFAQTRCLGCVAAAMCAATTAAQRPTHSSPARNVPNRVCAAKTINALQSNQDWNRFSLSLVRAFFISTTSFDFLREIMGERRSPESNRKSCRFIIIQRSIVSTQICIHKYSRTFSSHVCSVFGVDNFSGEITSGLLVPLSPHSVQRPVENGSLFVN